MSQTLRFVITGDTSQAKAAIQKLSDDLKGLGRTSQDESAKGKKGFDSFGGSLSSVKQIAAGLGITFGALGIAKAVKDIIGSSIEFESTFAGVRKTVDATDTELLALADDIRKMSKEIPTSTTELNRIAEAAGQLGVKKDAILGFTRVMADLGVTTNLTSDEAATALAQLSNIMGTSQKDFDRLGSALVALGNDGASTEKDIVSMGLRIAGAGKQVGLTESEVLSFASALSSVGIEAESGGSAISRVFIEIAKEVETGGDNLAEFARVAGKSAKDFSRAFKDDAAGATIDFIEGLKKIKDSGGSAILTLADLGIEEIRMRDALLRASSAGDLLRHSIETGSKAWEENTALTKEAARRYETAESQLQIVKNTVKDLAIDIGNKLVPVLTAGAKFLKEMIDTVKAGDVPVNALTIGVGAFAAALIGVKIKDFVSDFSGFKSGLELTTKSLGAFGTAAAVAGVALAGWKIGRLISDLLGLDEKLGKVWSSMGLFTGAQKDADAAFQHTTLSMADALKGLDRNNDALKRGGKSWDEWNKSLADALKKQGEVNSSVKLSFVGFDKYTSAVKATTTAMKTLARPTEDQRKEIDKLTDAFEKSLRPADDLAKNIKTLLAQGFSKHDIVAAWGDEIKKAAEQQENMGKPLPKLVKDMRDLVDTAQTGAPKLNLLHGELQKINVELPISSRNFDDVLKATADLVPNVNDINITLPLFARNLASSNSEMKTTTLWLKDWRDLAPQVKDETSKLGDVLSNQVSTVFTDMSKGIADSIIEWKGFGSTLIDVVKEFGKGLIRTFLEVLFDPLKDMFVKFGKNILGWLKGDQSFGSIFGGLLGGGTGGRSGLGGILGIGGAGATAGALGLGGLFGGGAGGRVIGGTIGGIAGIGIGGGIAGAAGGIGFGAGMTGTLMGLLANPWTAGIAAALIGGGVLYNKFRPTPFRSGIKETARDFGGIGIDKGELSNFIKTIGLTEGSFKGIRKDILSSPKFLIEIGYETAKDQGKVDAFLRSLESVKTAWGDFNFRDAFEKGLATGDFGELNAQFADAFKNSKALVDIMPDFADRLKATGRSAEEVAHELDPLREGFGSLKLALERLAPVTKDMYEQFFETGEITDELAAKITEFGGDMEAFTEYARVSKIKDDFADLSQTFLDTGEGLEDLIPLVEEFGGNLQALQDYAKVPGLKSMKDDFDDLLKAVEAFLPKQESAIELFLRTGEVSLELAQKIRDAGGNLQVFTDFGMSRTDRDEYKRLYDEFLKSGVLSEEFKAFLQRTTGQSVPGRGQTLEDYLAATKKKLDDAFTASTNALIEELKKMKSALQVEIDALTKAARDSLALTEKAIGDSYEKARIAVIAELDIITEHLDGSIDSIETNLTTAVRDMEDKFSDLGNAATTTARNINDAFATIRVPPIFLPPPPPIRPPRDLENNVLGGFVSQEGAITVNINGANMTNEEVADAVIEAIELNRGDSLRRMQRGLRIG